jgi:hypothetical protein
MVVGFTTSFAISAYLSQVVSLNPIQEKVYSIKHHVIKFVRDLRQAVGFLPALQFPPPIKLTAMI